MILKRKKKEKEKNKKKRKKKSLQYLPTLRALYTSSD